MFKRTYLYLIIYILFSQSIFSQNLQLKIEGKTNKETFVIDSLGYKKLHPNFKSIEVEVDSLQIKLYCLGYLQNEILKTEKTSDSTFNTYFNLKEKTNTIYIYYKKEDVSEDVLYQVSNSVNTDYFIIPIDRVETSLDFINSEIAKNGFPFSQLKLSKIKKNKNQLKAQLVVSDNSSERVTNNIIIKGYEKFPRSFLKHYLKIKPGGLFDLEEIKTKTEQLNNLPFASQIKPPEVLFTKDSTALYLYIEKKQSNTFDGFLGFGTNEETNKLEFDGYLNLNLTNNLNFGESLNLIYKSDENDQQTFNIDSKLPYLFKSPLGVELGLNIFKRDSSFTTTNQNAKLFYQLNSKHNVGIGINGVQSENLLNENTSSRIQDYKTTFYNINYNYLSLVNTISLFRINSSINANFGIGNRKISNDNQSQTLFNFDAFKIFNLNRRNSFYFRINSSGLLSDTFLENELFRIGGINSIRGFEENSINTSLFGLINSEYRFQLDQNIYIHSIIDAAYFENDILNLKEKLFGFGLGFGILTKSGLLRFIYANGKQEAKTFKFSNSKIHLSLSAKF